MRHRSTVAASVSPSRRGVAPVSRHRWRRPGPPEPTPTVKLVVTRSVRDRQTKDVDVSSFQRFDTDAAVPLTEHDLRLRWYVFHKAIRDMSGKKWQRVLGRILGVNTVRYEVARFFGRPLLQLVRLVRGGPRVKVRIVAPLVGPAVFPHNFRPPSASAQESAAASEEQSSLVEVVVLDESNDSATTVITSINELV